MSKIFDALNQKGGQVSDILLSTLADQLATATAPPPETPPPATPLRRAETLTMAPATAVRTVPLRIHENSPLLPFERENWSAGEQYRLARTKILQRPDHPHSIIVSSSSPGDGKTLTAINMAASLAIKGESRVLLVDADLRLSAVHDRLGISGSPGLTEALNGAVTLNEAVIRAQQMPDLFILPAGAAPQNPTELLASTRFRALCKAMAACYDYVVFDSPPIGVIADFELLQSVCDGVLLVVRPDHTPRKALFKALEVIPKHKLLGVLLNSVPKWFLSPGYHYSGYAGYYSNRKG